MTFNEFRNHYDYPGSVVLFGGKRKIQECDSLKLFELGKFLSENTTHIMFRTGNSSGSDFFFAEGFSDKNRLESVVPFKSYRKKYNKALNQTSLENFSFTGNDDIIKLSTSNKKTARLINDYLLGKRDCYVLKCSFIIRDTLMVIGSENILRKISFGLFYDDLENPKIGGTGHTMQVCDRVLFPYINHKLFFDWDLS